MISKHIDVVTQGRGFYEISRQVNAVLQDAPIQDGLCHLFLHHTSASLILCENADPEVQGDLERFFQRLVPENDPLFVHTAEGSDDMPAHIRTVLTQNSIMIPTREGKLALGTWQGVFVWEHRVRGHSRRVTVSFLP
jgi:secondary thiamine-phosphate synthase enzyme